MEGNDGMVACGSRVKIELATPHGLSPRVTTWILDRVTDRQAGRLGTTDSVVGRNLLGLRAGDEIDLVGPDGDMFSVTLLDVVSNHMS